MQRRYTVEGLWPFPLDMLRHDQAQAATDDDQALIDRLSDDTSNDGFGLRDKVRVKLVMESGEPSRRSPAGRILPNDARWRSFGWTVIDVPEITEDRLIAKAAHKDEELRKSGLAKLTEEERRALNL